MSSKIAGDVTHNSPLRHNSTSESLQLCYYKGSVASTKGLQLCYYKGSVASTKGLQLCYYKGSVALTKGLQLCYYKGSVASTKGLQLCYYKGSVASTKGLQLCYYKGSVASTKENCRFIVESWISILFDSICLFGSSYFLLQLINMVTKIIVHMNKNIFKNIADGLWCSFL